MVYRLVVYRGQTAAVVWTSSPVTWDELEDALHEQALLRSGERVRFGILPGLLQSSDYADLA